jgi:hypothetical protein
MWVAFYSYEPNACSNPWWVHNWTTFSYARGDRQTAASSAVKFVRRAELRALRPLRRRNWTLSPISIQYNLTTYRSMSSGSQMQAHDVHLSVYFLTADHSGRAVYEMFRPLKHWDCGFESHFTLNSLCVLSRVCSSPAIRLIIRLTCLWDVYISGSTALWWTLAAFSAS